MSTPVLARLPRLRPRRSTLAWLGPLVAVQVVALVAYAANPEVHVLTPVYLLVPMVWIDVGIWAVARTGVPSASRRLTVAAAVVGLGYFLLLSWVGGVLSFGPAPEFVPAGLRITLRLPPGFAPTLHYVGGGVVVTGMLYELVGYAALAYLVAARVLEASGTALSGLLGLFSCVSCTWPVVGSLLAAVFGGSSAVAAFATSEAYLVSTAVFLSAVALLSWRPSFGD